MRAPVVGYVDMLSCIHASLAHAAIVSVVAGHGYGVLTALMEEPWSA